MLLIGIPALVLAAALMLWLRGGRYSSTENAFVKADIVQVASEVSGRIIDLRVRDHAVVAAGDLLVRLDPEPYRLALAKADAEPSRDQGRGQGSLEPAGLRRGAGQAPARSSPAEA